MLLITNCGNLDICLLANGPSTYSRLVQQVMKSIPPEEALVYLLDDTCIHSNTAQKHLQIIEKLLKAFRTAGLTIQPNKTFFGRSTITYLGHQISRDGVQVPEQYTKVIDQWPLPHAMQEIRTFLGKVGYYRRFIKNFSKIAIPLSNYVNKENEQRLHQQIKITYEAEKAFQTLKRHLLMAPILAYPNFRCKEPFILDTDFSCDPGAIGGVLSQNQGIERVIAYGARKLLPRERNYSSNKGELLAIIFFVNLWKYYLLGRPFILRTDHEAIKWIRSMSEPKGMIMRWLELLSNYEFKVVFRPGKSHGNADALSRIRHAPVPTKNEEEILQGDEKFCSLQTEKDTALLRRQKADEDLYEIAQWLKKGEKPTGADYKLLSPELKAYANVFEQLFFDENSIICRTPLDPEKSRNPRICLPQKDIDKSIQIAHESGGHMGIDSTAHRILQRYYFPNITSHCTRVLRQCLTCQQKNRTIDEQKHTYIHDMVGGPWEKISIDIVGPLKPDSEGNKYIFTVKDCFTRYLEAFPCKNITKDTITKLLYNNVFLRYGTPLQCHSDNGAQLTSKQMEEICNQLGISKTTTPAYNPKSNPVERSHRDLGNILRGLMIDTERDWNELLPNAVMALNSSKSSVTGVTPHFAIFGHERRIPLDMIYGQPAESSNTMGKHLQNLTDITRETHCQMREKQQLAINRSEMQYNKNQKNPILPDDLVWLYTPIVQPEKGKKFSTFWTGPWRVIKKISNVLFEIKTEGNWNTKIVTLVVSHDRIKHYVGPSTIHTEQKNLSKQDFIIEDEDATLPLEQSRKNIDGASTPLSEAQTYLQAPRIWPNLKNTENSSVINDFTSKTDSQSNASTVNESGTSQGLRPSPTSLYPNDSDTSLLFEPEQGEKSVVSSTPIRHHEAADSSPQNSTGTIRKSSRILGLPPQYLGVDNKDQPKSNPSYQKD